MNNLYLKLLIKFQNLINHEDGQDMVEYALVVAMVALGAVAGVKGMAGGINTAYSNIGTKLGTNII